MNIIIPLKQQSDSLLFNHFKVRKMFKGTKYLSLQKKKLTKSLSKVISIIHYK